MSYRATNLIGVVGVVLFVVILSGCATIVSGRSQNIVVETDPSGANVTIDDHLKVSPATFTLKKTQLYSVRIEKEGFQSQQLEIKRGMGGWIFGNILFGGLIGVAVDVGTGSMYKLSPGNIHQVLVQDTSVQSSPKLIGASMVEKGTSKCDNFDVKSEEWSDCMGIK